MIVLILIFPAFLYLVDLLQGANHIGDSGGGLHESGGLICVVMLLQDGKRALYAGDELTQGYEEIRFPTLAVVRCVLVRLSIVILGRSRHCSWCLIGKAIGKISGTSQSPSEFHFLGRPLFFGLSLLVTRLGKLLAQLRDFLVQVGHLIRHLLHDPLVLLLLRGLRGDALRGRGQSFFGLLSPSGTAPYHRS